MGFKTIKLVRCISNRDGKLPLTIGEKYPIISSNCAIDSKYYLLFNDDNFGSKYSSDLFEIVSFVNRDNTGWEIKCNDCFSNLSYKEILEANNTCPKCGQKFI